MLRQTVRQSVCRGVKFTLGPLKVAVLFLWDALSDERSGPSHVSHFQQCLVHCQRFNIIYIVHVTCFMYMQYILDLCQHRLSTADHATIYAATAIYSLLLFDSLQFLLISFCFSNPLLYFRHYILVSVP
jgi:hypothetical protein